MDIQWSDLQLFLAVAEARSFSRAARLLKLGQPTVSRRIAQLEERIGQPLFVRGRDGTQLTPVGESLAPAAGRMAEWAAEVKRLIAGHEQTPQGTVRITAPPGVAHDFLAPAAVQVRERLPGIRLEVLSSIAYLDLSRGEADLALRNREPAQRDLECLHHLDVSVAAFATPGYASSLPARHAPADIDWITWASPYDYLPPRPQLEALIPDFQPAFSSDSFITQLRALELGIGAMILGRPHADARPGPALIKLDVELGNPTASIFLVCAKSARNVPKIQAVAEVLIETMNEVVGAGR